MLPILEGGEETLIGGQAVMDGVMMLAPHSYCVAVRKPDGQIVTQEAPVQKISDRYPIFKYPLIRGLGRIGQTMQLGSRALKFSIDHAIAEEAQKEAQKNGQKNEPKQESQLGGWMMTGSLIFSMAVFIGLFFAAPMLVAKGIGGHVPMLSSRFGMNMVDGVLRMIIFFAYLVVLSRPEDIQRVFRYHGAEHKVVFNYESGQPVTVENAQKFVTFHPRCGTCFLLVVLVVSIFVHALIPFDGIAAKMLARIALLPVVVGLSYELIRFAARRQGTLLGLITRPGLWLQRITTKPPTDEQAEVAIHALHAAMALEARQGGELVVA
jgi:uncharacterized protein YqhQ